MFGKDVSTSQQTVDDAVALVHLATLGWPLLSFADIGLCDDAIVLVHLALFTDHRLL